MARYRIFSAWFSHIHPKYRVPTRTVVVFTLASVGFVLFVWFMGTYRLTSEDPTIILGDLYNYGALVSFMLVNLALIRLRNKRPDLYRPLRSPFTIYIPWKGGKYELPLMPVLGFIVCLCVWILVLSLHEIGKIVGTLWFIAGIAIYLYYRERRNSTGRSRSTARWRLTLKWHTSCTRRYPTCLPGPMDEKIIRKKKMARRTAVRYLAAGELHEQ